MLSCYQVAPQQPQRQRLYGEVDQALTTLVECIDAPVEDQILLGAPMRACTPMKTTATCAAVVATACSAGAPPAFCWSLSSYVLHADDGRVLTPAAVSPSDVSLEHRPSLDVVMENTPPANLSAGGVTFRWHRNSMLPNMRVFVKVPAAAGPLLDGAAVLLSAVTIDVLTNSARSVGLEGTTLQPLINRECTFSSLSFRTTSFNLPGKPAIHIMATLLVHGAGAGDGVGGGDSADGAGGAGGTGGAGAGGGSEALDRCV